MNCVSIFVGFFSAHTTYTLYKPLTGVLNMYVPCTTNIPQKKLNSVAASPFEYFNRFDRFSNATPLYSLDVGLLCCILYYNASTNTFQNA